MQIKYKLFDKLIKCIELILNILLPGSVDDINDPKRKHSCNENVFNIY